MAASTDRFRFMSIQACPTDVVRAPAEKVWNLLTIPTKLERWSGAKLVLVPTRPLKPGDRLIFGAGFGGWMQIVFQVVAMERPRRLELDIHLPFGVLNHETVFITTISPSECRVSFN